MSEDISNVIRTSQSKHPSLDPWPTFLVKEYLDILAQPITKIFNASLAQGISPDAFKHAVVTPFFKKPSLPKDQLKSFRPISNLNFVSKVLERV